MEQSASQDDHKRPVQHIPLASHTLFTGGGLDDICNVMAEHFTPLGLRILADSPLPKHYGAGPQGDVSLHFVAFGAEVQLHPEVVDDYYAAALPLSGSTWLTTEGESLESDRETAVLYSPQQPVRVRQSHDSTTLVARLSRHAIDQAVRNHLGDEPATPLRFTAGMDLSRPAIRRWFGLIDLLAEEVECGALLTSPLAARHLEQLLIQGLLNAQPHTLSAALPGHHHAVSPHALRRAIRFCEEHSAEPISVTEIATAARTSIRTLQQQFRQHLGTTPMGYVRQIRLHHAHADLLAIAQGQARGTIADVARRWGFAHLSRFATAHQRAYGQLPSQTLRDR